MSTVNKVEKQLLYVYRSTYYGAQTILYCAMEDSLADFSGEYFADCNRQELALNAKNETAADMLWEKSLKVTNYL